MKLPRKKSSVEDVTNWRPDFRDVARQIVAAEARTA